MLLSDVKIIHRGEIEEEDDSPGFSYTEIGFEIFERNWNRFPGLKLVVYFHDRLSSEIKVGIYSIIRACRASAYRRYGTFSLSYIYITGI